MLLDMSRMVYSNTQRPGLVKALTIAGGVIGIGLIVLYFIIKSSDSCLFLIGWWVLYVGLVTCEYKFRKVVVDDEEGVIFTNGQSKNYPIKIAEITYIAFKESKKGKFRALFIHDIGVKFMEIRTSKANADAIADQLLKANPAIEVRHNHFI